MSYFDGTAIPNSWQLYRFADFLTPIRRKFLVDDDMEYRICGVRWYGEGVFIREVLTGKEIARKDKYVIKAGDVIYNKLFAWKGSFAIVEENTDGCCVSDKFPTYMLDTSMALPAFLQYYFRGERIRDNATILSKGVAAASKFTLNPSDFPKLEILLPPLDEQRRIVAKLDALQARVEQALALQGAAIAEAASLQYSSFDALLNRYSSSSFAPLKTFLTEPLRNGLSISASAIGEVGILFAKVGIVNKGVMNANEVKFVNIALPSDSPYWMRSGDIFVSRGNAINLVGRAAMYEDVPAQCAYPDLLIRIRVDESKMNPAFLVRYFHSQRARDYLELVASGTSTTMKKVSQPKLEEMPVPVIGLSEQITIVKQLQEISRRAAEMIDIQKQTQSMWEAMLPAALDRAFRGKM